MEGLRLKRPRSLRELIDQELDVLAATANDLAWCADPSSVAHAIDIGKYRGTKETIDRIEDLLKSLTTNKDDDEQ